MALPKTKRRAVILQKLRQSHGTNYMLCQQAADEIHQLRKEVTKLDKEVTKLDLENAGLEFRLSLEQ
tara:strand:+ start:204 stop:404 length:201 start_codon:yes stop_codon:yes gene_type:complete